jgi:hypothetical protein
MTDKWLEEIRKKISCPQLGDDHYGEWGILTKSQRFAIKRMLYLIESQEACINRLKADSKRLKKVQMQLDDMMIMHHIIKAEAYNEYADELARRFGYAFLSRHEWVLEVMENLLNELTEEQPPNDVKCIDCEHLEINGAWGVCTEANKMVHPNDCCGKGKLKGDEG